VVSLRCVPCRQRPLFHFHSFTSNRSCHVPVGPTPSPCERSTGVGRCTPFANPNQRLPRVVLQLILVSRHMLVNWQVVIFGDECILEQPIEHWPRCDVLVSFFSQEEGGKVFPLAKAQAYLALRQNEIKYVINDLQHQYSLLDRRQVGRDVIQHTHLS
jgi:hypothetical protein